jgi:hypothetical protein
MNRSEPKLIINLNLSDEAFEKHIQLAVDKYIESIVDSCANEKVTDIIKKYVDKKIDAILREHPYDSAALLNGKKLSTYIATIAKPKVEAIISDTIAQAVSEALTNKFKT